MQDIEKEKPSERIRYAVNALQEVLDEKISWLKVNMYAFHYIPDEDPKTCYSCLGGIAAIKRYNFTFKTVKKIVDNESTTCVSFTEYLNRCVQGLGDYEKSLDAARLGLIDHMFEKMGYDKETGKMFNCYVPFFTKHNPDEFINSMLQLAQRLEDAGY